MALVMAVETLIPARRSRGRARCVEMAGLPKAEVAAGVTNNEVVEQAEVEYVRCGTKPDRQPGIVRARHGIAAWVVVHDDEPSRPGTSGREAERPPIPRPTMVEDGLVEHA